MTPERVLQHAPLVLDQQARERYFAGGFLTVPGYVGGAWLRRLRAVVDAKIEESRRLSASDDQFDLAPDHTAEKPNIRRLRKAVDQHPELWAWSRNAPRSGRSCTFIDRPCQSSVTHMQANQHLQPTAASVPLAVPSSLRSSAAAEVRRSAHTRASRMEGAIVVVLVRPKRTKV